MKLKASLLGTASSMTLVLVAVGLLHSTTQPGSETDSTDALALVAPLLAPSPSAQPATTPATIAPDAPDGVDALLDRPSHTDTKTSETLKRRFSVDNSLDQIKQLDQVLLNLHPTSAKKPIAAENTTLQDQVSAHNWVGVMTGTLKQQDYEIKKLELALAQRQFKDGEIPQAALAQKQANYQKSARDFKTFLNSFRIAD